MPDKKNFAATVVAFAMIAFGSIAPAQAVDFTNVAFAQTGEQRTSIPVGHSEYCAVNRSDCTANKTVVSAIELTEERWQALVEVNAYYNQTIAPVTDQDGYGVEEFWTLPTKGFGDCEDYVLVKRKALLEAGWPASTLLIAVVRQQSGAGHAVLLVRTDRGDLALDNQSGSILVWNETPYQYLKRQSQANAGEWVDILDNRVTIVAAAR